MKEDTDINDIVNKYSDMIYRVAIGYFKNKDDAEDIVQDVFVAYIYYIKLGKTFINEDHEKYWFLRVSMNMCYNELKSAHYKRDVPLIDDKVIDFEFSEDEFCLLESINKLSEKYRVVFELFYMRDLKISEISKILNISESNVKTRLKRAREKLKEILQQGGYFNEEF